ncbi:MAG: SiaB family protein kinase [Gammaproteobacteria bacterium]|nr:SiaB family protein kinase [Gammaproteobacteria bacterium]
MKKFDLLEFRKQIVDHNIILCFEGKMSQGVLVSLVDTLKEKLKDSDKDPKQRMTRKVFSIFVEMAQNIQFHSGESVMIDDRETGVGIILIREDKDNYVLTSGNKVAADNSDQLSDYCNELNSLDPDQLKKMYKDRLRSKRPENSKGAGIGLIEISRKSGAKLDYSVQRIDDDAQFFSLTITLPKVD